MTLAMAAPKSLGCQPFEHGHCLHRQKGTVGASWHGLTWPRGRQAPAVNPCGPHTGLDRGVLIPVQTWGLGGLREALYPCTALLLSLPLHGLRMCHRFQPAGRGLELGGSLPGPIPGTAFRKRGIGYGLDSSTQPCGCTTLSQK